MKMLSIIVLSVLFSGFGAQAQGVANGLYQCQARLPAAVAKLKIFRDVDGRQKMSVKYQLVGRNIVYLGTLNVKTSQNHLLAEGVLSNQANGEKSLVNLRADFSSDRLGGGLFGWVSNNIPNHDIFFGYVNPISCVKSGSQI